MRVLLLHLSDLHIKTEQDSILERVGAIVDATQNLDYEVDRCIILTTGDIAFAGTEDQYVLALEFYEELRAQLCQRLSCGGGEAKIDAIFVPGNHDCLLDGPQGARETILRGFRESEELSRDPDAVEMCLRVQNNYGYFRARFLGGLQVETIPGVDERLCHSVVVTVAESKLRFVCYNTAWVSQNPERQGTLVFPLQYAPEQPGQANLTVSCLHHPYNWLEAANARQLRVRLEAHSDFIFTGHEHDAQRRSSDSLNTAATTYFEGGALQEHGEYDDNRFSALILDTGAQRFRQWIFGWDGSAFAQEFPANGDTEEWREYPGKLLQDRHELRFTEAFEKEMNDPGLPLSHNRKGYLSLGDIYVFPELESVVYSKTDQKEVIDARLLTEKVLQHGSLLITGDDQIGKSALSKVLVLGLKESGLTPVLVRTGKNRLPLSESLFDRLDEFATLAYGSESKERYRRVRRERRVVVIDDFDQMRMSSDDKVKLLERLHRYADHVVVIANSRNFSHEEIINPAAWRKFAHYRIREFNHLLRHRLCERWLYTDSMNTEEVSKFVRKLADVEKVLSTIIGKHFVPAYPPYMLAILQASEAATKVDTTASTHGYFYEMLIKLHLQKGETKARYDTLIGYLTHLSWTMFEANRDTLALGEMLEAHKSYQEGYDRNLAFKDMLESLVAKRILVQGEGDEIKFKYPYYLYYFIALHLKNELGTEQAKIIIARITDEIFVERNANVMLFLAHLSKDPFIIDTLIKRASQVLSDTVPATLQNDLAALQFDEAVTSGQTGLEDLSPEESSRIAAASLDAQEGQIVAEEGGDEESRALLSELHVGLQMVRILGQLLKNFPGTLKADPKFNIAQSCYSLGLRMLGRVLDEIKKNSRVLYNGFLEHIQKRRPGGSVEEAVVKAHESVVGLALLNSLGAVRFVAMSAGAPDLGTTYERVLASQDTPAVRLIDFAIRMEQGSFPEELNSSLWSMLKNNVPAAWVQKQLVLVYFEAGFVEDWRLKQRVCSLFGVSYKRTRVAGAIETQPRTPLLPVAERDNGPKRMPKQR